VFFVNVPIGVASFLFALRLLPESRSELRQRIDLAGAASVTGGLVVLVYAIVKAQAWGFGSGRTLGLAAVAVALLGVFVWIESRSEAPLVRLGIFRKRTLTGANVVMTLVAAGMFSMFFFVTLYVQQILGFSPLKAGLAFLPVTAGIIMGAGIAQQGIKRVGPRIQSVIGISVAALGFFYLTGMPADGSYLSDVLPALIPISFGMGMTFVPITLMATTGVHGDDQGLASGLLNTSQQVGGALGLAVLSTVAFNTAASHGGDKASALVSGYTTAFTVGGFLLAAGAALILVLIRKDDVAHIATGEQPVLAAA
jgi:predicted MFS family arabinose efflux permease